MATPADGMAQIWFVISQDSSHEADKPWGAQITDRWTLLHVSLQSERGI